MAPFTNLKTYSKKSVIHRRSSIEAFNALLAENLCKRKVVQTNKRPKHKKPIEIPELPPPDANHHLIEDSVSRSWGFEDTFDRLCKEPAINSIATADTKDLNASKSSNKITFTTSVHDPATYNTRSRSGPNIGLEEDVQTSFIKPTGAGDEKTLDKSVNISLFIEKVPRYEAGNRMKEITSLSSLSSGKLDCSHVPELNSKVAESSYEPLFSNTFRECPGNKLHIASTPAVVSSTPIKLRPVINETLSPILNCTEPKSLIEKSYEEIDKWNYKPPDAFESTPVCCSSSNTKERKQLKPTKLQKKGIQKAKHRTAKKYVSHSSNKNEKNYVSDIATDVKLKLEPQVVLDRTLDILGISESVKMNLTAEADLKGFPRAVYINAKRANAKHRDVIQDIHKSFNKSSTSPEKQTSHERANHEQRRSIGNTYQTCNQETPVRYLTLRKRNVAISRQRIKPKTKKTDLGLSSSSGNCSQPYTMDISNTCSFPTNEISETLNITPNKISRTSKINKSPSKISESPNELKETSKSSISTASIVKEAFLEPNDLKGVNSLPIVALERLSIDELTTKNKLNVDNTSPIEKSQNTYVDAPQEELEEVEESPDIIPVTPAKCKTSRSRKLTNISENIVSDHSYCSDISANSAAGSSNCVPSQREESISRTSQVPTIQSINASPKYNDSLNKNDNSAIDGIIFVNSDDDLFDDDIDYSQNIVMKQERMSSIRLSSNEQEDVEDLEQDTDNNSVSENEQEDVEVLEQDTDNNSVFENEQEDVEVLEQDTDNNSVFEFHNYSIAEEEDEEVIEVNSSDEENSVTFASNNCSTSPHALKQILTQSPATDKTDNPVVEEISSVINSTIQLNTTATVLANETLCTINESAEEQEHTFAVPMLPLRKPVLLKPGKSWRRSLLEMRRSSVVAPNTSVCIANNGCVCTCAKCQAKDIQNSHRSLYGQQALPQSPLRTIRQSCSTSILENYAALNETSTYVPNNTQDTVYQERSIGESVVHKPLNNSIHELTPHEVAREIVLRRCGQPEPIPFEQCYPTSLLRNCFKIGEGVYGEVYLFRNSSGGSSVMKVIPIEGSQLVNGEHQKKFDEILSEIVISMELSNLRNNTMNKTAGYSEVQKIRCVQGRYPQKLLELWDLYEETRGSENDSPEMFNDDQLYIVLELANGGKDMEAFVFKNSVQALALFQQIACALAVAESALEFEHRDLHWGNVLISLADKNKKFTFCLNGQEIIAPACGIEASIIDFTLSRIKSDGVVIYNDISKDPDLFSATGDYQFEVYKLMQKQNENNWDHFEPYTNILWLHYIIDKMLGALRYTNTSSKIHKGGIMKLRQFKERILKYSSVNELVIAEFT